MNCQTFREHALDLILPGTGPRPGDELAAHPGGCPACAQYLAEMKRTLETLRPSHEIRASAHFKERVMSKIYESERAAASREPRRFFTWRPALAAALLIIVGLAVVIWNINPRQGGGQAWAIEKTVQAQAGVRFSHMKIDPAASGHVSEMWAQFDGQGNLLTMRVDFPATEDGSKVIVWQADKATVWFKDKNVVNVVREPNYLQTLRMSVADFDAHAMFDRLTRDRVAGLATVEIVGPVAQGQPVKLAVTNKNQPDQKQIFLIDYATSLVTQIEKYQVKDGKETLLNRILYLDYNKPEVAAAIKIEAPADAMHLDETTQEIGLPKGSLSDNEIATQVAREFFEALIAKDYDKAGRLYEGMLGASMQKMLESKKLKFLRIVSIGEPHPHPVAATKGLQVPCVVEIQVDQTTSNETFNPGIRPVYGQPDRWDIFGGF